MKNIQKFSVISKRSYGEQIIVRIVSKKKSYIRKKSRCLPIKVKLFIQSSALIRFCLKKIACLQIVEIYLRDCV